jgi:hypothetical protein
MEDVVEACESMTTNELVLKPLGLIQLIKISI